MQGHPAVVDALNALLAGELAARDQYFIHARMLRHWGFDKIAGRIAHEMEEETEHADALIKRLLVIGAVPRMVPCALNVGTDVPSMLSNDLAVEYSVIRHLREVIALCEREADYVSREMLEPLLKDTEEDHAWWLEQQLALIGKVGLQNYLQSQM